MNELKEKVLNLIAGEILDSKAWMQIEQGDAEIIRAEKEAEDLLKSLIKDPGKRDDLRTAMLGCCVAYAKAGIRIGVVFGNKLLEA